jgi:P27 family predicted phage terminase small subunit
VLVSIRGRRPKPNALKELAGNPGKRKLNPKEPKFAPSEAEAPPYLADAAKDEWDRIAPTLLAQKILTVADRQALAGYCQAFADWQRAQKVLNRGGKNGGFTFKTGNGYVQQRPEVAIAQKALSLMLKFGVEFGLTPSSRSRMHAGGEGAGDDPEDRKFFKDGKPAGASHAATVH